ncbi:MAG: hypothetical protein RSB38_02915, partial [Oscillospiraceae bacterium]
MKNCIKKYVCLILSCIMCLMNLTIFGADEDTIKGHLGWSGPPAGWAKFTPVENSFTVDGKKFSLLEYRPENQDSKYLVIAQDSYGRHVFDGDNTQKFDTEDPNNVAAWLNNEFLTDGNNYVGTIYKLPDGIINNINPNHRWITECGWEDTNCSKELCGGKEYYTTTTGVVLMADYEYKKYAGKFGVLDNTAAGIENPTNGEGWFLRSSCQKTTLCSKFGGDIGAVRAWDTHVPFGIRPMFNLNSNFFKTVKLNMAETGANVKAAMADSCTKAELKALGYTNEELAELFGSGVKLGNVKFTDDNGKEIVSLVANGNVNTEVSVINNDETKSSMTALVCFYNKDGRLITGATTGKMNIEAGTTTKLSARITLPANIEGGKLKVLFWDSA